MTFSSLRTTLLISATTSLIFACSPDKNTDTGEIDTGSNNNGIDSGAIDPNDLDVDEDGYSINDGDCDDENPNIHPNAVEICDEIDNDCDSLIDEDDDDLDMGSATSYYLDIDGDGFGLTTDVVYACRQPDGYVIASDDCDDNNIHVYPGAPEVCDGLINDCDIDLAEEIAFATFTNSAGVVTDMTQDFSGTQLLPNAVAIYEDGVLELCGDFYATLTIATQEMTVKSSPGGYISTLDAVQTDHVITMAFPNSTVSIENLRITGGYAMDGGGVFNPQSSNGNNNISITGCEITGNHAWDDGGGIHMYNASLSLVDTIIHANLADNSGGGIYTSDVPVYLENTSVFANLASNGAGIRVFEATLDMINSGIYENIASSSGGGLSAWISSVNMTDSFIRSNSANVYGGGIMLDTTNLTCTATTDNAGGIVDNSSMTDASGGLWVQTNGGDPSYVIQSNNCDWGSDIDGNNNVPNDIVYQTGNLQNYGQMETFTCTSQNCQ